MSSQFVYFYIWNQKCSSSKPAILLLLKLVEKLSKDLFRKYGWPTIDITRKSVEETAASVIKIYDIMHSR